MKLTVKSGRGTKIHIYVDDEYRATVDSDFWYSERFKNLKEINEEELTELLSTVSFRRAYNKGLDFLSRRPFGKNELVKKLCEKGIEKEYADMAVERLEELKLIDDEVYAEMLASELVRRKGYSNSRVLRELVFKGIDREIAQNAVEALDNNPQNRIILLVEKKYANKLNDEKGKKRTIDALLRLGYSYYDIKSALNHFSVTSEDDFYEE